MDLYCQMNGSLLQIHTFETDGTFKTSTGGHENPYDASYVQVGNWVKATYFYSRYPELEMEDADIIYTVTEQGLTSVWDVDAEMISGYENAYMVVKLVEQTT